MECIYENCASGVVDPMNTPQCLVEDCDNTTDDDTDGDVDCADSDCDADPACIENCTNMVDDDGNGDVDCADADCVNDPACNTNVPPGWTCVLSWYDEDPPNEFCDCECGAVDPDCSNPNAPVEGCAQAQTCNAMGMCEGGVPPTWTCNPAYYDAADGCDCSCGATDPDCALPNQMLYCDEQPAMPGQTCVNNVCTP
jgi:hypothetical protein